MVNKIGLIVTDLDNTLLTTARIISEYTETDFVTIFYNENHQKQVFVNEKQVLEGEKQVSKDKKQVLEEKTKEIAGRRR